MHPKRGTLVQETFLKLFLLIVFVAAVFIPMSIQLVNVFFPEPDANAIHTIDIIAAEASDLTDGDSITVPLVNFNYRIQTFSACSEEPSDICSKDPKICALTPDEDAKEIYCTTDFYDHAGKRVELDFVQGGVVPKKTLLVAREQGIITLTDPENQAPSS